MKLELSNIFLSFLFIRLFFISLFIFKQCCTQKTSFSHSSLKESEIYLYNNNSESSYSDFKSDSTEIIDSSMKHSSWSQKNFKKSFKILLNEKNDIFIQVNFTNITYNDYFPLVSLSKNSESFLLLSGGNTSYTLSGQSYDLESYYLKRNTHYLYISSPEYNAGDILYITVFNLFNFEENDEINLEYTIFLEKKKSSDNLDCFDVWNTSICQSKQYHFETNHIEIMQNYEFNLQKGEIKYFFSNYTENHKKMLINIETQGILIFLKDLNQNIDNDDGDTNILLNDLIFYCFQDNFVSSLPHILSQSNNLAYISFLIICPWDGDNNKIKLQITKSEEPIDPINPDNQDQEKLRNIIYTMATLGITVILLCIVLSLISSYFRYRRRNFRFLGVPDNEDKLTKNLLDIHFPARVFESFKKESIQTECAICLQEFVNNESCRILYCLHIFHEPCVDSWILIHQNCPICRKEYKKSTLETDKLVYQEKLKNIADTTARTSGQNLITIRTNPTNE